MKINKNKFKFIKTIINNIIIKNINIKIYYTNKKINNLFDFFIICEGNSSLHISSLYNNIKKCIFIKYKILPSNIEGIKNNKWILIDYNFIIINIFLKKIRKYYKIDNLFSKFPIICNKNFLKIK
ncbi:MAG: hypothetical protein RDO_0570 [Flavobacteriales endosymbiont of Rhyzopertha dominica]|nr:MAG: ribosome silencing factor [Candidatus Shikimatogenerans bostrichidophilus]